MKNYEIQTQNIKVMFTAVVLLILCFALGYYVNRMENKQELATQQNTKK